jgi:hypothetical protein
MQGIQVFTFFFFVGSLYYCSPKFQNSGLSRQILRKLFMGVFKNKTHKI